MSCLGRCKKNCAMWANDVEGKRGSAQPRNSNYAWPRQIVGRKLSKSNSRRKTKHRAETFSYATSLKSLPAPQNENWRVRWNKKHTESFAENVSAVYMCRCCMFRVSFVGTCLARSRIIDWLLIYQFHTSSHWFCCLYGAAADSMRWSSVRWKNPANRPLCR